MSIFQRKAGDPARRRGYTLMELLIVITLIAITTSFAVSSYRRYIQRTNRVDAVQLLLRVAAAQERYYLDENRYAMQGDLDALGFPSTLSEDGYYVLTIATGPSGDPAIDYVATASVIGDRAQAGDTACRQFTIDQSGLRGSAPQPPDTCWK